MNKYKGYVILDATNDEDKAVWAKLCDKDDLEGFESDRFESDDDNNIKSKILGAPTACKLELERNYLTWGEKHLAWWNYLAIKQECYDKYIKSEAKIYSQLDGDLPEVQTLIGQRVLFSDTPACGEWETGILLNILDKTESDRYEEDEIFYTFIKTIPQPQVVEVTMADVCKKFGKTVKIIEDK